MTDECIAVFTARSPQRILREGGSQAWALDANRARKATYLVCIQNQHNPDRDFSDASETHGSAFMVGKVSDVVPAHGDDSKRWQIRVSEYAIINVPNAWKSWRNPVRYTTLDELGVDLKGLKFRPVTNALPDIGHLDQSPARALEVARDNGHSASLSMAQAKPLLAAFYEVPLEAVEIVIRG